MTYQFLHHPLTKSPVDNGCLCATKTMRYCTCLNNSSFQPNQGSGRKQQSTFNLAKRDKYKLESLDSEFKVHHYAVVDVLDKPEDFAKEQEVLDEHDDSIAEVSIRMQKVRLTPLQRSI